MFRIFYDYKFIEIRDLLYCKGIIAELLEFDTFRLPTLCNQPVPLREFTLHTKILRL